MICCLLALWAPVLVGGASFAPSHPYNFAPSHPYNPPFFERLVALLLLPDKRPLPTVHDFLFFFVQQLPKPTQPKASPFSSLLPSSLFPPFFFPRPHDCQAPHLTPHRPQHWKMPRGSPINASSPSAARGRSNSSGGRDGLSRTPPLASTTTTRRSPSPTPPAYSLHVITTKGSSSNSASKQTYTPTPLPTIYAAAAGAGAKERGGEMKYGSRCVRQDIQGWFTTHTPSHPHVSLPLLPSHTPTHSTAAAQASLATPALLAPEKPELSASSSSSSSNGSSSSSTTTTTPMTNGSSNSNNSTTSSGTRVRASTSKVGREGAREGGREGGREEERAHIYVPHPFC